MSTAATIAQSLGVAFAAGINLPATVAVLGTAGHFTSARALTADVETALREFSRPVAGWSEFPSDGTDASVRSLHDQDAA